MTHRLDTKLVLVFVALIAVLGALFLALTGLSAQVHRREVTQELHATLAQSLIRDSLVSKDGLVNDTEMRRIFDTLMVVNPSIEVYLLDREGRLLRYSAPPGKIKLGHVALSPIQRFLEPDRALPILGDDPRNPGRRKVFSAAPVIVAGERVGYLYVVLESDHFESVSASVWGSTVLRLSSLALLMILVFGLCVGVVTFWLLTRRLRQLDHAMTELRERDFRRAPGEPPGRRRWPDEIDRLERSFYEMARRIDAHLEELRRRDATRRQLVANVSHDLRTPLASLNGYLETLALKWDDLPSTERSEYLRIARKGGHRLTRLIDDLCDLALLDVATSPHETECFSLTDLAQDVAQGFGLSALERGVCLVVESDAETGFVCADLGGVERVLENLIENALRHTPRGGRVHLGFSDRPEGVEVRVSDTGTGIPEGERARIFEPLYRGKAATDAFSPGMGLGLAIAQRIVELHGGQIDVHSEVRVGTCFSFVLPVG